MPDGVLSVVNCGKESEWEWKINNFSLSSYYYYLTPFFKFEGESWCLYLYTNSFNEHISLQLCRSSSVTPIEMEFSVSIKTTKGMKIFERRERCCFKGGSRFGESGLYDINKWINRLEFSNRQREFLSSGCLTILITMMKADSGESETAANISGPSATCNHDSIIQDLKQLLLNQEQTDVILKVKGKEFSAHKTILAARSSVFASTFRYEMKENKTGIVDIEDCDPAVFPDFLRFLYSNDTDNLSSENVFGLFKIADKYDCQDLGAKCVHFMKKNLTVETFCKALALALLHNEAELIRVATDFFIENADKILLTDEWHKFASENITYCNELFITYVNSTKRSSN